MEYVLPVATVGVLILGVFVSGEFDLGLQSQLKGGQKAVIQNKALKLEPQGQLKINTLPNENLESYFKGNGITYSKVDQLCLYGQYCTTVPNIPAKSVVEVDGGLGGGTVSKLAKTLNDLADQLQASGADSNFVARIRALANKGHDVASGLLSVNPYKDNHNLPNPAFADTLCDKASGVGDKIGIFKSALSDLNQYLSTNTQIQAQNPEAIQLIRLASENIENSGHVWPYTTYKGETYIEKWDQVKAQGIPVDGIVMVNKGKFVEMNANTICQAGEAGPRCMR
ncbi:MAG: hypothetical protein K2X66_07030 [Cyanobacteria bacterium]|nr:hypothetical protein [Cyanobacteriota bacterium]